MAGTKVLIGRHGNTGLILAAEYGQANVVRWSLPFLFICHNFLHSTNNQSITNDILPLVNAATLLNWTTTRFISMLPMRLAELHWWLLWTGILASSSNFIRQSQVLYENPNPFDNRGKIQQSTLFDHLAMRQQNDNIAKMLSKTSEMDTWAYLI